MKKIGKPNPVPNSEKHRFKPGKSGNPDGRPPDPIPNALKKMTKQSYRRIIKTICKGNVDEIQRVIKDPKSSALEVGVAACYLKAINRGDYATIEQIIVRVVGKIPDELNIRSKNQTVSVTASRIDTSAVKDILKELNDEF